MPRPLTQIDPTVRSAITAAYSGGATLEEISGGSGVSVWILRRVLKEDGVASHRAVKRPKFSDVAVRQEIVRRYAAGESAAWLSEVYGCSHGCTSKVLVDSGVQLRNRDRARPYGLVWTDCKGRTFYMRSSWEVKVGHWLDLQRKNWDYEVRSYEVADGRIYTPDFWVYDDAGDVEQIVDVKGQWTKRAEKSVALFIEKYPSEPFEVWERAELVERGILDLMPTGVQPMNTGPRFRMRRELRKQIIDLYQSGRSAKQVSVLVGRRPSSVKSFLRKSGLTRTMSESARLRHQNNRKSRES